MFAKNYLMLNFNPNFLKKIDLSHYNLDVNSFYIYMDNVWEDGISGNKIRKLFGNLEEAKKSMKRIDHSVFVSLKYTRTVDVIKTIFDMIRFLCHQE